ncbi:hypothetical protein LCGC14_0393840 [marine sediment metagenome]|uniref:Uncharacterized protein n=1 Tax=marine sediment metagenome TaxID=412755 RepID=A0A0F9T4D7_9ZZZZ
MPRNEVRLARGHTPIGCEVACYDTEGQARRAAKAHGYDHIHKDEWITEDGQVTERAYTVCSCDREDPQP